MGDPQVFVIIIFPCDLLDNIACIALDIIFSSFDNYLRTIHRGYTEVL